MGNLCSTIANGINYVLRIVFPFSTSFLPARLELEEEKCFAEFEECYPRDDGMSVQYNDEPSAVAEDDSRSSNSVANLKLDKCIGENTGNAGLVFSIVKDFFRNYSFQTNLLSGNLRENKFIFDHKNEDEDIFLLKKEKCCVENSCEIVSVKEIKEEQNKLPSRLELTEEKCLAEIEECYPRDNGMSVQYNDESSAVAEDDSLSNSSVANLKLDQSIGENTGNAGLVLSIVKDFFRNYSSQTNLRSGNLRENTFIFDNKNEDEDIFLIKKENCCVENSREIVSVKEINEEQNNLENEDFLSIRKNEEKREVFNSKCLNDSKNTTNKTTANGFSSRSTLKDVSKTVDSRGENLEEFTSTTISPPEGFIPSVKTSGDQDLKEFSSIKKKDAEDNWSSNGNKSIQPTHANKPYLRKLSLPQMQSGCHFSVLENDENVKITHYNSDSTPLDVPVETHRRVSHPNLYSGGLVAFEELSEHLSLPNYYTENPIIYEKQSYNLELPQCPTAEEPEFNSSLKKSGGRLIADNARRVSLPDLFPEKNPLLRPVTSEKSTQNSASFGVLMNPDDEQEKIFADLLSKSKSYDLVLTSRKPNNN